MKALLFSVALLAATQSTSRSADTFGNGAFDIEFVTVGHTGNAADTTGYGAVDYEYRIAKYEVSRGMIETYNTMSGGPTITMTDLTGGGGNGPDRAAIGVHWNAAARFVNWLNTSAGYSPAYKFNSGGINDNMLLWTAGDAGYDASNLFRNSEARYFLPSENEWYKAAYYDPAANVGAGGYWDYATGNDTAPTTTSGGTAAGTAVYRDGTNANPNIPANIMEAGGLSPLGTMAQNGNAAEALESGYFSPNDDPAEIRVVRGGHWQNNEVELRSSGRSLLGPSSAGYGVGFRVASKPAASQVTISIRNIQKSGNTVTADIESTAGNVDVYRSLDLLSFGPTAITTNLAPGAGVVIDTAAPADQAFYRIVLTGIPLP